MPASRSYRLVVIGLAASLALAAIGAGWELVRFGASETATAGRLQSDVERRFAQRARQLQGLANRVAGVGSLVEQAVAERDRLPALFSRLAELAGPAVDRGASVTMYVREGLAYRVIAWSAGPSDSVARERLASLEPQLFVAQGAAGVRLIATRPIEADGRRVAVAVTETLLAAASDVGSARGYATLETTFGPVVAVPPYVGGGASEEVDPESAFTVNNDAGTPLIEIAFSRDSLTEARGRFRRRVVATAALPLVVVLLLLTGPVLARASADEAAVVRATVLAAVMVGAALAASLGLLRLVGASPVWYGAATGLAGLGIVALGPGTWWWRSSRRRSPTGWRIRFALEHLAGGLAMAVGLIGLSVFARQTVTRYALDRDSSPLFAANLDAAAGHSVLLIAEIAVAWGVAALLASLAGRWRVTWRRPSVLALALWLAPTVGVLMWASDSTPLPSTGVGATAAMLVLFALWGSDIRHRYRHTSQAMRLVMLFAAMVLPAVLLAQLLMFYTAQRTENRIEFDFARAIAGHPADLRDRLRRAQDEIDGIAGLADFVRSADAGAPRVSIDGAFSIWRQTNLYESRLTSEVELFGPVDGRPELVLASRFGLNVPEFESVESEADWARLSCEWVVYDELKPFGTIDRRVLHAERAICGPDGARAGAIVVHVLPDYQSLPFISSGNTYYGLLTHDSSAASPAERDLAVVVYGWGLNPLFASTGVAWPIGGDVFNRLYASREPFWTTIQVAESTYRVYLRSDRGGIYTVGYPLADWFDVVAGLAETTALVAVLFVLMLLGATLYGPFSRRQDAPLRTLFFEIRTSFYRKLFLFFVLAAVGPVLLLTLTFRTYMSNTFNADVESEATALVTVARQVLEQITAAVQHPDEPQRVPTDDQMVLISQMINQDVNLYSGPDLVATSQRDLFTSGLLPTRTPVAAYRAVALDRLPSHVATDRLGSVAYMIAAAPIPVLRQNAVLTVPLGLRQQEIEEQLEALNRGVLVGAVLVVLFAAGLGASVAGRISDPVARLSRATRQIAAGQLDVRIVADTADELRRLVDDFNTMTARLVAQRAELARSQQLKAWAEMARQVAHEIKNPLTPVQLAAEHLQRVHEDRGRPLGPALDQCVETILRQVRLLRTIASEFSNFAGAPTPLLTDEDLATIVTEVTEPYSLSATITIDRRMPDDLPPVRIDRTLVARALTNLVENAVQAMPGRGTLTLALRHLREAGFVELTVQDTGVGMDAAAAERAFEPYFSTKTAGSGLGLANAKRNVELCGGAMSLTSAPNEGTTVTVRLPASSRDARESG